MNTAAAKQPLPRLGYIFLAAITIFWGLNWPGMKITLAEVPVWWFRASCVWFGAFALLSLSALSGNRIKPRKDELAPIIWCAVFNVCGWHIFSAYGVSQIPAGRASIIAFTMPLWASLLAVYYLQEKFSLVKALGLALGMSGLGVLIGTDLILLKEFPVGSLLMLGAAVAWAMGTVLFKRGGWDLPVASSIAWQLIFGAIPITLGAILIDPFPDLRLLSLPAWIALIYVFLGPMTFCQWAYLKVVHMFPASIAAIGTLMIPVVGVYSSSMILEEHVGWSEVVALGLICLALVVVLVIPSLKVRRSR
ncbi:MAG: DMT family transporter [Pseudomonadota bacterium]